MIRGSKTLLTTVMVLMITLSSFAQGYHFIYIQADGQQPFYLKYKDKNYSSSSIGYLILPKLSDGDVTVQIGFPKDLYPEQTFNLSVAGKDYGYALKNFADKGWGLFNFQTTDIVMNANGAAPSEPAKPAVTTDKSNPFGNMLADAINDSTLNQKRVATNDNTSSVSANKDTVSASLDNKASTNSNAPQIYQTQASVDSLVKAYTNVDSSSKKAPVDSGNAIVKSSEQMTSNGTDLTFLDNTNKDTIHAFIPSGDSVGREKKIAMTDTAKSNADNPFFNSTNNANTSIQPSAIDSSNSAGTTGSIVTNTNCQTMLSSYDIDKLRKKIAKTEDQKEILEAIKKALRDKCVTTEQVKDFGDLFSSDENRYNFYEAVYPHVSDYFNFPQLQGTLIDSFYKNRFKALLH